MSSTSDVACEPLSARKRATRRAVLQRRRSLPPEMRSAQGSVVRARLGPLLAAVAARVALASSAASAGGGARAARVAAFAAMADELDTTPLLSALAGDAARFELLLPRVASVRERALTLHRVRDLERDLALSDGRPPLREPVRLAASDKPTLCS